MNEETAKKISELSRSEPELSELLEQFVVQADATVELASQCDIHPMLHAFAGLNKLRENIVQQTGEGDPQLYTYGGAPRFMVDSIFDEILDSVVEGLAKNCLCNKEKP